MEHLKPEQIPHCERLFKILDESVFACDFSVMGAGKTYIGNVIGYEYGLPIFVFGPRGSLSHWEKVSKIIGSRIIISHTYESLRSIKGHQPKHGYLTRYEYEDGSSGFAATQKFKDLVKNGVLLIADECQKIKNNSAQTKAIRALVREILDVGGKSRILLISGSPFEEPDHAINFFRLVGFIEHPKLYTVTKAGEFVSLGLSELIDNISSFRREEIDDLVLQYSPITKRNVRDFVFTCFTDIIVPYFTSALPSPIMDYKKDVANGYYLFEKPEEEEILRKAIFRLETAASFNPKENTVQYDKSNMGEVTLALKAVEKAKVPIWVRRAKHILDTIPGSQYILFANFTETIDLISQQLTNYKPLIYDGRTNTRKKEDEIIRAFQAGEGRLLLANLKKGGYSLNLHDTIGGKPRFTDISPTFSILDMHQASGRTYRQNLKTDATIRVVYGEVGSNEMRILKALSRKTENMKRILIVQAKEGVLFPGDYPEEHEMEISA